jgi:integrase/recombinase XerC
LEALEEYTSDKKIDTNTYLNILDLFLASRREGISPNTIRDYEITLCKALKILGLSPTTKAINEFLSKLDCSLGGKYGYYKCIRAFFNWLYSPRSGLEFTPENNPITWVDAPKRPVMILASLTKEQVELLIDRAPSLRDKAIISLFTESGLRLIELTRIKSIDIDWQSGTIRVMGKGRKEALAPFGTLSCQYLTQWLTQFKPNDNIWGINHWGITSMLRRLEKETNIPCNPHVFRRTFACLLRKAGVDTMTIKDLGRWESLEMVQRYTRSFSFKDALKHYKPPLG